MKKTIFLTISFGLFIFTDSFCQRVSTGFTWSFPALHHKKLPEYVMPPHSYFIYKTDKSQMQAFNGFNLGVTISLDYKRWILFSEVNFGFKRIKGKMIASDYLYPLDKNGWVNEFLVTQQYVSFPLILTYKLTQATADCPFVSAGVDYTITSFKEKNWRGGTDLSIDEYIVDTEMYGVLYNENNYFSLIVGLGFKVGNTYTSLRYKQRVGSVLSDFPTARYYQLDIHFTKLLTFQKLRKGYHLYLD